MKRNGTTRHRSRTFTDAEFYTAKDLPVHGLQFEWLFMVSQDVLNEESMFYFSEDDNLSANMTALVREIVTDITEKTAKSWNPQVDELGAICLIGWEQQISTPVTAQELGGLFIVVFGKFWMKESYIFPKDAAKGKLKNRANRQIRAAAGNWYFQLPYSLQRFVVGSIFEASRMKARKSADAVPNLRFAIMLDELNRFCRAERKTNWPSSSNRLLPKREVKVWFFSERSRWLRRFRPK